jgi:flagellar hook protein FlgE
MAQDGRPDWDEGQELRDGSAGAADRKRVKAAAALRLTKIRKAADMALTGALFTGLSGLATNQTRMNVVGNNIANVNTTAFKSSRALFSTQSYVTDQAGGPPSGDSGGTNPSQIGLGATVGAIDTDFSEGSIQNTGQETDMAINGDGFFVVNTSDGQEYTRDGSFKLNGSQDLTTQKGDFVQGYGVDANNQILPNKLQNITIKLGAQISAQASTTVQLSGNLNTAGDLSTGASEFQSQGLQDPSAAVIDPTTLLTDVQSTSNPGTSLFSTAPGSNTLTLKTTKGTPPVEQDGTFTVTSTSTVGDLMTFINNTMGIDTTAGGTPTPGAAIDPVSGAITVTGNVGSQNGFSISSLTDGGTPSTSPLSFTSTGAAAKGESITTGIVAYDSLGQQVSLNVTATYESTIAGGGTQWQFFVTSPDNVGGNLAVGNGTLTFDGNGNLTNTTGGTVTLNRTGTGAEPSLPLKLDFSGMSAIKQQTTEMKETYQDGSAAGTLTSFSIGETGVITGNYSNNLQKTLGQVVMAKFNNPDGLTEEGDNMYKAGANSGLPVIATPGSQGMGTIQGQSLELSNVDLSTEFVNLIVASTGFTAASRVITTSNQLITELLNTTR